MHDMWFDDLFVGQVFKTQGATLTESQIIDFGLSYDPQELHINTHAGEKNPFGAIIASGFQTLALSWRLFIDTGVLRVSSLGGPGLDDLRWFAPVFAGDSIRSQITVIELRPSSKKTDRGNVRWKFEVFNQNDVLVLKFLIGSIVAKRPSVTA